MTEFSILQFFRADGLKEKNKKGPFTVTKEGDVEKEVSDALEHPNGRPMAWKSNQLGSGGQRK